MKRFYIAAALIILLVACGVASLLHVDATRHEVVAQIDRINGITEVGLAEANSELDILEDIWTRHLGLMMHHIHHEKLDLISIEFTRARENARNGEFAHMYEALAMMRWLMESVYENEMVHTNNIF